MTPAPLLDVRDLRVTFRQRHGIGRRGWIHAVRGVTFTMAPRETFALVGESGSGKSTTARGILRLIPASGQVLLDGQDVLRAERSELRRLRAKAQMVFQDPYSSINPSKTIADILAEPLRTHTDLDRRGRLERAGDLLEQVGLRREDLQRYPHEFSGGQRQRIAIARALTLNPRLAVCDEAVSALDVSTQNQVLNLLEDLRETHDVGYLFITHNLGVVHHFADRVGVMYLGRLVEVGDTEQVFSDPAHPYTRALLAAMPVARPGGRTRAAAATTIAGELPSPAAPPPGCAFHPRCPLATDLCRTTEPVARRTETGGEVACHLYDGTPVTLARRA